MDNRECQEKGCWYKREGFTPCHDRMDGKCVLGEENPQGQPQRRWRFHDAPVINAARYVRCSACGRNRIVQAFICLMLCPCGVHTRADSTAFPCSDDVRSEQGDLWQDSTGNWRYFDGTHWLHVPDMNIVERAGTTGTRALVARAVASLTSQQPLTSVSDSSSGDAIPDTE